ncbi:DUF6194 family protein [Deinococcus sp.]|uniref:DUF6194 family protein n=1 Tax=Deinococcus sp. TaxID=47478 RepID=UPI003CC5B732
MNEAELAEYLTRSFESVDALTVAGNHFFFYSPGPVPDHRLPFVTLMINDDNDAASKLGRPGIFRLNIGVGRKTYRSLFGPPPAAYVAPSGYDYTALDTLLPHPVYAQMGWVCVLNPSPATFAALQPLLAQAYERAVRRVSGGVRSAF